MHVAFGDLWGLVMLRHDTQTASVTFAEVFQGDNLMRHMILTMLQQANASLCAFSLQAFAGPVDLCAAIKDLHPLKSDHTIVLLYFLYFFVLHIPIYFTEDDIPVKFRENLAYFLIKGHLPM